MIVRSLLKKGFFVIAVNEKGIPAKIYFLGDQAIAYPASLHGNSWQYV